MGSNGTWCCFQLFCRLALVPKGSQAITVGAMRTAHGLYVVLQFDLAVDSEQSAEVVPSADPLLTCCAWLRVQL